MTVGTDVVRFIRAFGHSWASLMSGPLSVPFAIFAVRGEGWQRVSLALLSLLCLVISSFIVWRREHERAEAAEARLEPKLAFVFDTTCRACYSDWMQPASLTAWPSDTSFFFARRFGVKNLGTTTIDQVAVFLERLEPVTSALALPAELRPMNQPRSFRNANAPPSVPLVLNPSGTSHEHINFLFSGDQENRLAIDFAREPFLKEIPETQQYKGTIRAEGKDVPPIYADFLYSGDTGDFVVSPRRPVDRV